MRICDVCRVNTQELADLDEEWRIEVIDRTKPIIGSGGWRTERIEACSLECAGAALRNIADSQDASR